MLVSLSYLYVSYIRIFNCAVRNIYPGKILYTDQTGNFDWDDYILDGQSNGI